MDQTPKTAQQQLEAALAANPEITDVAIKVLAHVENHMPAGANASEVMNQAKIHLAQDIAAGTLQESVNTWKQAQNAPGSEKLPGNWARESASIVEAVHIERDYENLQR
jgi:hypothetical protein